METTMSSVTRMGDWLKKQAEREAEKEQRRAERLHRKLKEPEHHFSDAQFQQQCHDLSERLEDSVLKGGRGSAGTPPPCSGGGALTASAPLRSAGKLQRSGEVR